MTRPFNPLLTTALAAALGTADRIAPTEIQNVPSAAPLSKVTVVPVKPGHPKEPRPQRFELDGHVCYVREADWPALRQALARRKSDGPG